MNEIRKIIYRINDCAATYYHDYLNGLQGKIGGKFLIEHFHLSEKTIKSFEIGYAGNESDLYGFLKKFGFSDEELILSDLFVRNSRFEEVFKDRIVFPIKDESDRCLGFCGRTIEKGKFPKYLIRQSDKIERQSFFGLNIAGKSNSEYILLCEGINDVLIAHDAGLNMVVTPLNIFTKDHAMLLKDFSKKIIICFDADEYGKRMTRKVHDILEDTGIEAQVLETTPYQDISELINNVGKEKSVEYLKYIICTNA